MKKSYWKRQTGWAKPFIQSPSRSRIGPNQRWETMSYSRCSAFSWARWQGPGINPGTQCAMGPFQQAPLLQAQMPQKLRTFLSILTHTSSLASTITNICPLNKTTTITIVLLLVMFLLFCWFKHLVRHGSGWFSSFPFVCHWSKAWRGMHTCSRDSLTRSVYQDVFLLHKGFAAVSSHGSSTRLLCVAGFPCLVIMRTCLCRRSE